MEKKIVNVPGYPFKDLLSQAVRVGNLVFTSGAVGEKGDAKTQTKQALEKIKAVLEQAGTSMDNVVKMLIFCTNIQRDYSKINEAYMEYFRENPPARSCVEISALAKEEWVVEIEAVAVVPA